MPQGMRKHEVRDFEHLIGKIDGLSEEQLRAHFGLYEGYVKKLNEIETKLAEADRSSPNYSFNEYSELQRRHAVPFNGAYLHQLYFEGLCGDRLKPEAELKEQIERDFGSVATWWKDVSASLTSAHGWVLVTRSRFDGRIYNSVVEEHHRGVLAEQDLILALDGWEHAYMIDYGTTKKDYIDVLKNSIDWRVAGERFTRALRSGVLGERARRVA